MSQQGYATQFFYGNQPTAAASTFTALANVLDVKPPKIEAEDIDTSHMLSPNQFKQFSPGWATGGEIEVKLQWDKAQNATIYGLFRKQLGYQIRFNDGTIPNPSGAGANGSVWQCDGYLKSIQNEVDREHLVTADITVKITGQPVFTQGS